MSLLCARALEAGIEVPFVRSIIERRCLSPPADASASRHWPWPVRVSTLGDFELAIDGVPRPFQGKTPKVPLRLLKAILGAGGAAVSHAQLGEALWPGADGDMARRTLDTTVHRLRKLLVHERAVLTADRGLRLDPDCVWVDAFVVERLAAEILRLADEGLRPGAFELDRRIEALRDLYRGPFLAGEDEAPLVGHLRKQLRRAYIGAVVRYGELLEGSGRAADALALYQGGIRVEDTAELFYQRALDCHALLGERAEAALLWKSCRAALAQKLGIEPSPLTHRAFERAS